MSQSGSREGSMRLSSPSSPETMSTGMSGMRERPITLSVALPPSSSHKAAESRPPPPEGASPETGPSPTLRLYILFPPEYGTYSTDAAMCPDSSMSVP